MSRGDPGLVFHPLYVVLYSHVWDVLSRAPHNHNLEHRNIFEF